MKRLVQEYIRTILRHPLLFIQLPLLIVFTLSYNILYDFTVKQFNSLFLYGVQKVSQAPDICTGKYVTQITLQAENVLDVEYLKKVEEIRKEFSCVIAPATEFGLRRSLIRYFNEMNIPLAHLFLDNLTYSNHFIHSARILKVYVIHDGEAPMTHQAKNFLKYYSIQAGLSKAKYYFWISNVGIFVGICGYLLHIYLALANSHRVRSNLRVLWRWLMSVFLCCFASASLITKMEGAKMWNLVFEPLTMFTKASYFLMVVVLCSRNMFTTTDILERNKMVNYYSGWHGLPLLFKILLKNLAILAVVLGCCLMLVFAAFKGELQHFLEYQLMKMFMVVVVALIIEVCMELTFFVGVVIIDLKKESLNLDEGANVISSWLKRTKAESWRYRLGTRLLRVKNYGTDILHIPLGVLLMLVMLSHWTIVMPEQVTAITVSHSNTYIYYLEYMLLVVFIVAIVALVVPPMGTPEPVEFTDTTKSYNSILLNTKSDILRISTNTKTSSIVTTSLDHRVLFWTPQGRDPEPINIDCDLWPVNHLGLNDDGSFIVLVNFKGGVIKGFDKKEMRVKWTQLIHTPRKPKVLESFFRRRTVPGFLARKMIRKRRGSDASMSSVNSLINANFPPPIQMKSFGQKQRERKENISREEFVMVLDNGEILVVSCSDGKIESYDVKEPLTSAIKIRTPRVLDRIVVQTTKMDIIVVNIINNNMKFRQLKIESKPLSLNPPGIYAVEFVGFFIRVEGLECQLIDVNTGVIMKLFAIGNMKPNTLKVSFPEPSHCRFCGSAALSSFSVMYENEGSQVVVVHTFKVDKKAICLRVERDPREIRCVGFGGADENVNWYNNVVGYEVTAVNLMIGVVVNKTEEVVAKGTLGLQSLRNRKIKKQKEYQLMVVSLGSGKAEYYPYNKIGTLWQVVRYGHKSVILNLGSRMEIVYLGNSNLIEYIDDNSLKFNRGV